MRVKKNFAKDIIFFLFVFSLQLFIVWGSHKQGVRTGVADVAAQMHKVIEEHPETSEILWASYQEGLDEGKKWKFDACDGIDTVYVIDGCGIDSLFIGTRSSFTIQNCTFTGFLEVDYLDTLNASREPEEYGAMVLKRDSTEGAFMDSVLRDAAQ